MGEHDGEAPAAPPGDLAIVEARISELRRQKRATVRWHMSRQTAERAIAAITEQPLRPSRRKGKSRRRRRHKRLL